MNVKLSIPRLPRLALITSLVIPLVSPAQDAGQNRVQQRADPAFDASVKTPAYAEKGPRLVIDEAHFNVHTADGQYKVFATLAANDGYQVSSNKESFSLELLKKADILVIANARGEDGPSEKPAFKPEECDAVRDWVTAGGNLLLVTDHYPIGHGSLELASRLGVDLSKGTTFDAANAAPGAGGPSALLYSRSNQRLADHAITNGRSAEERVNNVITFTGLSLKGPEGSVAFLKLADTATDRMQNWAAPGGQGRRPRARNADLEEVSAAGRAQGIAFTLGTGRVVVLGEASQLSAQLSGPQSRPMGMNFPGTDNRQMALNILHWLSRLTH